MRAVLIAIAAGATLSAAAVAQKSEPSSASKSKAWVAPGTKGSPIDGETFHAQVLLDAAGFTAGVIDGKKGSSLIQAIKGFQEAKGLQINGKLDAPTRQALLQQNRQSTRMIRLADEDVSGPFVYPFPKKYEDQAKLKFLGYRNMLEKVAERYHTTPATIVALNGPDKLIGPGQILKLPNVVPQSTDYSGANDKQSQLLTMLNVEGNAPKADYIVVDKSDGTLKVYRGSPPAKGEKPSGQLVAQFPVTTGSGHDPLPLGTWKTTTYSFLPPFNFQPDLFWDVSDDKAEQKLPPGPNGPVGVAWLDLTKEHYGIHGTSEPQTIQKTESHGCLRLTNWDVMRLSLMLKPGFTAVFVA
ncbi:L,D-transpeptidase family protein [Sphingomonas hankyongi]|uniref:L,D-transpeptidase family protein n=1 Tax=Sphingomonas hankyongi TaxID=2908209 RepID=A0ABT0S453_9SPHN|nr:L,D-transpeptidase family protein [Sphingomonas hankyongi]MCL6730649.1 L,D-transpeptidase family protein [Sphingomonas hankyongi]